MTEEAKQRPPQETKTQETMTERFQHRQTAAVMAVFQAIALILAPRLALFLALLGMFSLSLIAVLHPSLERMVAEAIYGLFGILPIVWWTYKKG